ncbi:hypothetical protein ACOSQ3_007038 [Xanthoceras sorbifolium]
MNHEIGLFLGGLIGQVKEIHIGEGGDCLGKFLRVRVMVDALKPLKRGIRVALRDDEEECSVLLCYERLTNFYYCCGRMGHLLKECMENKEELVGTSNFAFGSWLRAPVTARSRSSGGRKSDSSNSEAK